jgi:Methyltransferase domain
MGDIGTAIRQRRAWQSQTAVRAYGLARAAADRLGLQLVLKTYYSPIPDWSRLPAEVWTESDPMLGIGFDLDAQLTLLERELSPLLKAFAPDEQIGAEYRYEFGNASFPAPDARLLFAMVRQLRPRSLVELGSGQTSRVISHACRLNAAEGHASIFRAFDPFPTAIDGNLPGLTELVRVGTQDVPEEVFAGLGGGDMLIVDTTHTVKLGSEVNRIILRLLPLLAPGAYVHFHDICLPYEYPRYLFKEYGLYWAEQYLLQAFLSMNPSFEVVCAVHALCQDRPERTAEVGLGYRGETGGSFWIRRLPERGQD